MAKAEETQAVKRTRATATKAQPEKAAAPKEKAEKPKENPEKLYTEAEMQQMIGDAVARAMAEFEKKQAIRVTPQNERVMLLWQAPVADDCVTEFGERGIYGRITGPTGSFFVPKDEISRMLDGMVRMYLDRRWLIVVSGLDEEERAALGVNYREGEYLTKEAFTRLLEQGDKVLEFFPQLCPASQKIVAERYYEGWKNRSPYVTRDRVVALNQMAKDAGNGEDTFRLILQEMNEREAS